MSPYKRPIPPFRRPSARRVVPTPPVLLSLPFTPAEFQLLEGRAEVAGLSLGDWAKAVLLNGAALGQILDNLVKK